MTETYIFDKIIGFLNLKIFVSCKVTLLVFLRAYENKISQEIAKSISYKKFMVVKYGKIITEIEIFVQHDRFSY